MLAFFTTGGYEWIIILIVALLLFGRRLPEVMRSMGQGIHQFKRGLNDVQEDLKRPGELEERDGQEDVADGESGSGASPAG